jgi:Holliday junction resolvase
MSVTVGGDAGLRTRGTAIFAAAAAGGFTAVRVDVVAENTASAKSKQMMIENCILGQGE